MKHELKTHPEPFEAVMQGNKTHEWRKHDRDFRVGDTLALQEWDPETKEYTGSEVWGIVGYITKGPDYGVPEGYCVMSFKPEVRR